MQLVFNLLHANEVSHKATVKLVTYDLETYGWTKTAQKIINRKDRLLKNVDIPVSVTFLPVKRAVHQFYTGEADVIFPEDNVTTPYPFPTISSLPVVRARMYIYTRKQDLVIRDLGYLKGLRLGLVRGTLYRQEDVAEIRNLRLIRSANQEQVKKMLLTRRVDAALLFELDEVAYGPGVREFPFQYHREKPFIDLGLGFRMRITPTTQRLKGQLDKLIRLQYQDIKP
ncbi:hypothetical protein HBA55_23015 [Pseudomaricurvus alkylphenolicus]|uniref:hypothetical protein n=1 Tax=Pseudomaricurvus alkylphenolicus TaxID=1306991 RepID=UPI00141DCF41|nr:hypothetical protein [Pseudomaricurvus alkylphenolicus]NIB42497.1 hypothetical protein [Pseudomaricurvus alkylphenolicus]